MLHVVAEEVVRRDRAEAGDCDAERVGQRRDRHAELLLMLRNLLGMVSGGSTEMKSVVVRLK